MSKPVKILILEQIVLTVMFYFGQVFLFWRLINKNVLEWFLPIICKEHTVKRSTTLFSRNHLKLCFWLRREFRRTPSTEQLLLHLTSSLFYEKSCSLKFRNINRKHLCWSLFLIKFPAFRPATSLERDSNTSVFLLQNF